MRRSSILDSAALTIGTVRLSLLLVAKAALLIAILLWAALALARLVSGRIEHIAGISPSVQTLTRNLVKIALVFLALLIGLNAVGIDLTAFTVLSGAIGVGLGFGLQKIVANFVSGIILLAERSIKPGDIIEVGGTHGFVTSLGGALHDIARPRRQGIPDPERDIDHEPGGQLVLYQPVRSARSCLRRRLRDRSAAGAAARDRGGEGDAAGPVLAGAGLSRDRIRR